MDVSRSIKVRPEQIFESWRNENILNDRARLLSIHEKRTNSVTKGKNELGVDRDSFYIFSPFFALNSAFPSLMARIIISLRIFPYSYAVSNPRQ